MEEERDQNSGFLEIISASEDLIDLVRADAIDETIIPEPGSSVMFNSTSSSIEQLKAAARRERIAVEKYLIKYGIPADWTATITENFWKK
jgi:hypothetical protein